MSDQHANDDVYDDEVEAELGLALSPVQPRPEVKARLMAAIADLPQNAQTTHRSLEDRAQTDRPDDGVRPIPMGVATDGARADGASPDAAPRHGAPVDDDRIAPVDERASVDRRPARTTASEDAAPDNVVQLNRWRRTATWLGAAAAVLLVAGVALGGWAGSLNQQRAEAEQRLAAQTAGRDAALEVFTAPDAVIRAGKAGNGGSMSVASSKSLNRSAVISRDLPALASGKTYELWYIAGQQARPAGTFSASGNVTYTALEGQLDGATHVGVTVEPAGGSKAPTTTPIVLQPTEA
ncbi:anti-sigma factor [Tersicoccus sp. MR15.9]|uniref:anti-sigma factor n=1 Tax=Tersicoccus mangrovi TaxID=3121635 RepID=UPI002FE61A08